MKRITLLFLSLLLLCGLLSGCISSAGEDETTAIPTEPTTNIPVGTTPRPTVPIETIPKSTDDSDYQLPPGERPTVVPEIK